MALAIAAQQAFRAHNEDNEVALDVKVGISAGEPVTDGSDDLFGASVQLAARLCAAASASEILVSVAVRELCVGKQIRFEDCGPVELKGLSGPTVVYRVSWQDDT